MQIIWQELSATLRIENQMEGYRKPFQIYLTLTGNFLFLGVTLPALFLPNHALKFVQMSEGKMFL